MRCTIKLPTGNSSWPELRRVSICPQTILVRGLSPIVELGM
jgi:hypothetical protein